VTAAGNRASTEWKRRNPERAAAQQARYHRKLRLGAVEALGATCADCGITEEPVLQVHHIHGGGNDDRRRRGNHGINRAVIAGEPGYELLCSNCHILRHTRREFPTTSTR
jgi:hypothetical protein